MKPTAIATPASTPSGKPPHAPLGYHVVPIECGAMRNAPVWENGGKNAKNWMARISLDPTSPGGLNRGFFDRARGDEFFYVVGRLEVCDALEFGADRYNNAGILKSKQRCYCVVSDVSAESMTLVQYESARAAIESAQELYEALGDQTPENRLFAAILGAKVEPLPAAPGGTLSIAVSLVEIDNDAREAGDVIQNVVRACEDRDLPALRDAVAKLGELAEKMLAEVEQIDELEGEEEGERNDEEGYPTVYAHGSPRQDEAEEGAAMAEAANLIGPLETYGIDRPAPPFIDEA